MRIFDHTMEVMGRALDSRSARQRVIASNIANEETPGYRAKDLKFKEALAAARHPSGSVSLRVTHNRQLSSSGKQVDGHIIEIPVADLPLDANSVNLDLEMAKLTDNAMHYNTTAELMARKFRGLLRVINEGR